MSDDTTTSDLRVEVTVERPLDHVFSVFTTRIDEWWPRPYRLGPAERADVRIDPQAGRWYEVGADGSTCDWGRVLAWDPPRHVALGWQLTPTFDAEPDPERASRVDVWFSAVDAGRTVVTLEHCGFERHGDGWQSMRDGVDGPGGWPGILAGFSELAAR